MKHENWLQLFTEEAGSTSAVAGRTEEQTGSAAASQRMTWKQIMDDPEYSTQMQKVVQHRLRGNKAAEQILKQLQPALSALASRMGQDPEQPDYEAISAAVCRELSPETGYARHFERLYRQAEALRRLQPDFSLEQAMEDGAFLRMTAPGGVSVEDAYYALHRSDIQQATMTAALRRAAVYLTNAIRSGTLRPREAGTSAQAPTVTTIDYRSATPEQREAIKRRIREGWARGENINPF